MVVAHLDDERGLEWLPGVFLASVPAARSAGGLAGESGRRNELLQLFREARSIRDGNAGGEPDVVQQAVRVVEAEEQRADDLGLRAVAEAANHAIRAAEVFDLLHAVALARAIVEVAPFGDDAIERRAGLGEPLFRLGQFERGG